MRNIKLFEISMPLWSIILFFAGPGCINVLWSNTSPEEKSDTIRLPFETGFELRYGFGIGAGSLRMDKLQMKQNKTLDFFMDFPLKSNWRLEMGFGFNRAWMVYQNEKLNFSTVRMKMQAKMCSKNGQFSGGMGGFLGFLNSRSTVLFSSGDEINFEKFYLGPEGFISFRVLNLPRLRSYLKCCGNYTATRLFEIRNTLNGKNYRQKSFFLQFGLGFTFR